MKRLILFVDDEPFFALPYKEQLDKIYLVHVRNSPKEGLQAIRAMKDLSALVLDIMMPPPEELQGDASINGGLDTGLWFLSQIKDEIAKRPLPVVILTNRDFAYVKYKVGEMKLPANRIEVRAKIQTPSWFLPQVVAKLLDIK